MDNRRAWLIALVCAGSAISCGNADTSFSNSSPHGSPTDGGGASGMSSGNGGAAGGGGATGGRANGGSSGTGGSTSGGTTSNGGNAGAGGATSNGGSDGGSAGGTAGAGGVNAGGAGGANTGGAGGANTGGTAGAGGASAGGAGGASGGNAGAGGANTGGASGAGGANTGGLGGVDGGVLDTYVSGTVGDDSNPGTQALPVQTIAKGIANAVLLGGNRGVFVAAGHYPEKVTLVEGIDLGGGYRCDATLCTWTRNPTTNDTAILNQDEEGVLADDTITRATVINGFRIMGQNGGATGRGRVAITLRGGSPSITENRIFGATTSGGTGPQGRSIGILILSPSNNTEGAIIQSNQITGGQASDQSIGISFESSGAGSGTGAAAILQNVIRGGSGTSSAAINAGNSSAATFVQDNDILTGSASVNQAWAINLASRMTIDGNRINVNNANVACRTASLCGGINSLSSTSTITNNVIFGVDATHSVGVRLMEAEIPSGVVILNSNTIDGAGTSSGNSTSVALQVEIGACAACGFNGFVGHIRNNILLGGLADSRFAIYEQAPSGRTQHPDILENNDLYVSPPLAQTDALYRYFDGTNQTLFTSITLVNGLQSQVARMTVGSNIPDNPNLDASFNLVTGSKCIDVGTASEAPSIDKNRLARPQNGLFDIGADEF